MHLKKQVIDVILQRVLQIFLLPQSFFLGSCRSRIFCHKLLKLLNLKLQWFHGLRKLMTATYQPKTNKNPNYRLLHILPLIFQCLQSLLVTFQFVCHDRKIRSRRRTDTLRGGFQLRLKKFNSRQACFAFLCSQRRFLGRKFFKINGSNNKQTAVTEAVSCMVWSYSFRRARACWYSASLLSRFWKHVLESSTTKQNAVNTSSVSGSFEYCAPKFKFTPENAGNPKNTPSERVSNSVENDLI